MKTPFALGYFFGALTILCIVAGVILNVRTTNATTRVQCSSFATQQLAQIAYNMGATSLDGDGDGIACEDLLK